MYSACDYAAAHVQQSCGTRAHRLHVSFAVTLLLAVLAKRLNTTPVLWDEMQHAPYFNYRAADGTIHQVRWGAWGCGLWQSPVRACFLAPASATCTWQAAGRLLHCRCQVVAFRWQEQGVQVRTNFAGKLICR